MDLRVLTAIHYSIIGGFREHGSRQSHCICIYGVRHSKLNSLKHHLEEGELVS